MRRGFSRGVLFVPDIGRVWGVRESAGAVDVRFSYSGLYSYLAGSSSVPEVIILELVWRREVRLRLF